MTPKMKSERVQLFMVVLGLFLVIGLVAGGTYFLNDQDLIGIGDMGPGEMPEGPLPELGDGESRPARPDVNGAGMGFNSQLLMGLLKVVLQIILVIVLVTGARRLLNWPLRRRRRVPVKQS